MTNLAPCGWTPTVAQMSRCRSASRTAERLDSRVRAHGHDADPVGVEARDERRPVSVERTVVEMGVGVDQAHGLHLAEAHAAGGR